MSNTIELNISEIESRFFEAIYNAAEKLACDAYVIGGYVRDQILGRSTTDIDIVTEADGIKLAEEVAKLLPGNPNVIVYKNFGTALVEIDNYQLEFVGARKESYRSGSRKPKVSRGTIQDDRNRRDFTINALSVKLNNSNKYEVIDPFDGLNHLLNEKVIKTPLEPEATFSDDPLRMMRAIRFATQLNFRIDPETYKAIKTQAYRLEIVSQERITTELNKIIEADKPSRGFEMLLDTGLLAIFFPEFVKLHGVEEKNGKAHKDNFFHTLEVLDNVAEKSDNLWLRWAALLHDIGKPDTKRFKKGTGWTFHGHDALGAKMVKPIFRRLRLPLDHKMKYVRKLVRLHLRPIALTFDGITDSAVRRLLFDAGEEIDDLMILCRSDITSKNPTKVKRYLENYEDLVSLIKDIEEKDKLRNWEPPIDGQEIMDTFGLKPSQEVGIIKNKIREAILDGNIPNDYDSAYKYMLELGEQMNLKVATS